MADLPPNHHADYPQFSGIFGYVAGLTMIVGRGGDAKLVTKLAGVGPTDDVLDIGCGPGTAARHAAGVAGQVTGLDPSKPMLRLARALTRRTEPILWVVGGAEEMNVPDDSQDVVWSLASVHHWPDLDGGIAEASRVLRPAGTFLALEKRAEPGATGNASHGWTDQQAETFAEMLTAAGFVSAVVSFHEHGRRRVVVVTAQR